MCRTGRQGGVGVIDAALVIFASGFNRAVVSQFSHQLPREDVAEVLSERAIFRQVLFLCVIALRVVFKLHCSEIDEHQVVAPNVARHICQLGYVAHENPAAMRGFECADEVCEGTLDDVHVSFEQRKHDVVAQHLSGIVVSLVAFRNTLAGY